MACVVEGCKSHSSRNENKDESLTYHRFPNDDEMKIKWIQCINRFNWSPKQHSRICSKHFTKDSFVPNDNKKWRRLKSDAVPILNIPKETSSFVVEPLTEIKKEDTSIEISSFECSTSADVIEPLTEIKMEDTLIEISSFKCSTSADVIEPLTEIKMEDTSINFKREISSFECSISADKDKIEASSEKKIRLLEKQVENLKNISKRRLRRINTLTKRIARLSKKNVDLYNILLDRLRLENR